FDRDRNGGRSRHVPRAAHTQTDLAQESGDDGRGGLRGDRRGGLLQSESPSDSAGRQTGFLIGEPVADGPITATRRRTRSHKGIGKRYWQANEEEENMHLRRDFLLVMTLAVAAMTPASAQTAAPRLGRQPRAASNAPHPSRISRASGRIRFPVSSRWHRV